ncbi:regulatory components of ABA receptor 3 [Arabidopsis thaliana]|jgi:abscisic acid receptor (PYR/PYL family)|uniref:Regulatory components of ABA receptor 3 n=1 Tax=Arabidopsis thaliana TaxID=3702 RepID=F4KJ16_ARATH|nr:regulatory components of ABA receptor 3 [Arabidopsis thaliana]AED96315.1 regulatory components of ABA receptor 3 [Arabidopsis thaliana]|eukprot:NP_851180.1 regulatory components of ABA receptor 3 [Arabidopsis thaliana]
MEANGIENLTNPNQEREFIRRHHKHELVDNQCSSTLVKHINAPVHIVWSLVRRFDQPQKYKPFISRCVVKGNMEIGTVREVDVKSGLPATRSTERLELLDDNEHILSIRIVGGDHRLKVINESKGSFSVYSESKTYMFYIVFGFRTILQSSLFTPRL